MRRLLVAALAATGLSVLAPVTATAVEADAGDRPAVVEARTIGHSVRGRPIRAWRLGEPGRRRVVLISTMHGNEPHTRGILESLRDGRAIRGVDLWVIPTYNPDGLARGTRRNARGVDLNRNFPFDWADLDGNYESGPRPGSEPETRAVMRFLEGIDPFRVVSFHQPLNGVDTDTKDSRFARRLARALRLPQASLDCGGLCHGTLTMWFNHHFRGAALTVEYGARPARRRMVVEAPRQVLGVLGAHRASRS
ncbi:M14 family zinc carboxypeptidase [Nocardioides sp.]|uniref:M14 family zinc carboxypeptidase n=1 Tax=Nocardioides sp. TaxID=35761 RepID=UPI00262B2D64|nr:M14 family zinc carboxypeptidase [Nocardioides sp.]MCW2738923.1 Protein MpaA [Nocardioides sp.]